MKKLIICMIAFCAICVLTIIATMLCTGTYQPIEITAYAQTVETETVPELVVISESPPETETETVVETETETETESETSNEKWYPFNDGKACSTTCYCLCPKCCGKGWKKNITASGATPQRYVTVANGSLPFGTEVYIEDVGYRIVQDRGSAVGATHFDIYVGVQNHDYARSWYKQYKKVWIVKRD